MANGLYFRLAKQNLLRNRQLYLPYFIATALISAMFFIIFSVVFSQSITNMSFGGTMVAMLTVGVVVMAIFTFCYMLYINSFLIKRRKTEFGLYAVLGLEKRHVSRIIFLENAMLDLSALATGLLCGTVFGKLIFMALMAVLKTAEGSVFELHLAPYLLTSAIFFAIFLAALVYNLLQVHLANPISLLHGEKRGEKKLRGTLPLTLLGLLFVGGAYWFSITVAEPGMAIGFFWPAVVLVIFGTHMLFAAGSQLVLRALKKNKRFYYKPGNFITVSGLMHRLKENAAGLANICILSTMVLVTVSSCCALFFGQENILRTQHPNDYLFTYSGAGFDTAKATENAQKLAVEHNVAIDELYTYEFIQTSTVMLRDGRLSFRDENGNYGGSYADIVSSLVITEADYDAVTGETLALADNELLVLSANPVELPETLDINGSIYRTRGARSDTVFSHGKNSNDRLYLFFVTADGDAAQTLCRALYGDPNEDYVYETSLRLRMNLSGDSENKTAFAQAVGDALYAAAPPKTGYYMTSSIDTDRAQSMGLYGGLLFLGAFFAILFLINTALILYFKQVSEGYDDRERFVIMQKVGMSDEEVSRTINKQVLIVFFLPILVALCHILAACNIIVKILSAFAMSDILLTLICIVVTTVIFALVYLLMFRVTARTYYRLVKW